PSISTVAGNGTCGFGPTDDGNAATSAQLGFPGGVALDTTGAMYIADGNNCRVRKVTAAGTISTLTGTSVCGYTGDGGAASTAQVSVPLGVVVDSSNNLFIADTGNCVMRKINFSTGSTISTTAGNHSCGFYGGDGGPATNAP